MFSDTNILPAPGAVPPQVAALAAEYDRREGLDPWCKEGCCGAVTLSGCPYCGGAHAYCFRDCDQQPEETYPCTGWHGAYGDYARPCPCDCDYCRLSIARDWRERAQREARERAARLWRDDYLAAHPEQREIDEECDRAFAAGIPAILEDGTPNPGFRPWELIRQALIADVQKVIEREREIEDAADMAAAMRITRKAAWRLGGAA